MLTIIESTTNCTTDIPIKRAYILIERNLKIRKKTRPNTNIFPIPINAKATDFIIGADSLFAPVSGLRSLNIYFIHFHNTSDEQKLIIIPIAKLKVIVKD
jgi:hypothetical protein